MVTLRGIDGLGAKLKDARMPNTDPAEAVRKRNDPIDHNQATTKTMDSLISSPNGTAALNISSADRALAKDSSMAAAPPTPWDPAN